MWQSNETKRYSKRLAIINTQWMNDGGKWISLGESRQPYLNSEMPSQNCARLVLGESFRRWRRESERSCRFETVHTNLTQMAELVTPPAKALYVIFAIVSRSGRKPNERLTLDVHFSIGCGSIWRNYYFAYRRFLQRSRKYCPVSFFETVENFSISCSVNVIHYHSSRWFKRMVPLDREWCGLCSTHSQHDYVLHHRKTIRIFVPFWPR